jgi:hypothetical protein
MVTVRRLHAVLCVLQEAIEKRNRKKLDLDAYKRRSE